MFDPQLDVATVSNLEVADTLAPSSDSRSNISLLHSMTRPGRFLKTCNGLFSTVIGKRRVTKQESFPLLQLRVLPLGIFENRDIRVGVLPKRKKILIGLAGAIFLSSHSLRASELKMGERPR